MASVVCFVPDLMDRSRITAACPGAQFVSDASQLSASDADVIVVDASRAGVLDVAGRLGGRVIGFAPHVDEAVIAAGRAVGVDVLPRSRFFARLAELLDG
jgi:hypothetical protein